MCFFNWRGSRIVWLLPNHSIFFIPQVLDPVDDAKVASHCYDAVNAAAEFWQAQEYEKKAEAGWQSHIMILFRVVLNCFPFASSLLLKNFKLTRCEVPNSKLLSSVVSLFVTLFPWNFKRWLVPLLKFVLSGSTCSIRSSCLSCHCQAKDANRESPLKKVMRKNAFLEETAPTNKGYAGSSTDSCLSSLKPPPSLVAMKEACADKHTPPGVGIQTVP